MASNAKTLDQIVADFPGDPVIADLVDRVRKRHASKTEAAERRAKQIKIDADRMQAEADRKAGKAEVERLSRLVDQQRVSFEKMSKANDELIAALRADSQKLADELRKNKDALRSASDRAASDKAKIEELSGKLAKSEDDLTAAKSSLAQTEAAVRVAGDQLKILTQRCGRLEEELKAKGKTEE